MNPYLTTNRKYPIFIKSAFITLRREITKIITDVENKLRKIIFGQVLKQEKVTDDSCATCATHKLHEALLRSIAAQIKQDRETIGKEGLFALFSFFPSETG